MKTTTTITICLDADTDLSMGGFLHSDAAVASYDAAWCRAARRLGFRPTFNLDREEGADEQVRLGLWQAAHDACTASRPGRWGVTTPAAELRAMGRRIRGGK